MGDHPERSTERDPNKRITAGFKGISSIIDASRSSGTSIGGSVGIDTRILREEIASCLGKKPPVSAATNNPVINDSLEYSTPELAIEAYRKGAFKKQDAIKVACNLGLLDDNEADDTTPAQAIAMIEENVEDGKVQKVVASKPKEPVKKGMDYPKFEKKQEKIIEKSEKKVGKKRGPKPKAKAQATPMSQPSQPMSAPSQPMDASTQQYTAPNAQVQPTTAQPDKASFIPGQIVRIPDPNTKQYVNYQVQADGSMKPMVQKLVTAEIREIKVDDVEISAIGPDEKKTMEKNAMSTNTEGQSAMIKESPKKEAMASSTIVSPLEQKTEKSSKLKQNEVKYTAKRKASRWLVCANDNPLFSVGFDNAFPIEKTADNKEMFESDDYGQELAAACNMKGVTAVMGEDFEGDIEFNMDKTPYDYEAELLEAVKSKSPEADEIMTEYHSKYPEEAEWCGSLYNDTTISNEELVNKLTQCVAEKSQAKNDNAMVEPDAVPEGITASRKAEWNGNSSLPSVKTIQELCGVYQTLNFYWDDAQNVGVRNKHTNMIDWFKMKNDGYVKVGSTESAGNAQKRTAQYNQYGLGDSFERTNAPDSQVDGGGENLKQEGEAIMDSKVVDETNKNAEQQKSIVDLFAEVMAPIIAVSDIWTVEDIVLQMSQTFSDDAQIAKFKGTLEEKIKQDKEKNANVIREKSDSEQKQENPDNPNNTATQPQPNKPQAQVNNEVQQAKAMLDKGLQTITAKLRTAFNSISDMTESEVRQKETIVASLEKEVNELKDVNGKLIKERVARLRLPKAKILASNMNRVGIKTDLKEVMNYTEEQFKKREAEIVAIINKTGAYEDNIASEPLIGAGILPQMDANEGQEESRRNPFTSRAPGFTR